MTAWLRILSEPVRNITRNSDANALLDPSEARHELLLGLGTLRSTTDAETSNVTVTLSNDSGQCARLFATPPVGSRAEVRDESGIRFVGTVQSLSLDDACSLEIQA